MKDGITLSPKHGLNPTITHCPICGAETGIALYGKLNENDDEAPKDTISMDLCKECQKIVDDGKVFVLEVESEDDIVLTDRYIIVCKENIKIKNKGVVFCARKDFEVITRNAEEEHYEVN